jgi:hypothetical protein
LLRTHGTFPERIGHEPVAMSAGRNRRHGCAVDDHRQEFVGADKRYRWPLGHGGTDEAVAQAV